jgi:hypothetical protein
MVIHVLLHSLIYIHLHSSSEAVQGLSGDSTGAGVHCHVHTGVGLLKRVSGCRYYAAAGS